jgi:hypothetical protein
MLTVVLLFICACAYVHAVRPSMLDAHKTGPYSIFWKAARIGERCSPAVGGACILMAFHLLFIKP